MKPLSILLPFACLVKASPPSALLLNGYDVFDSSNVEYPGFDLNLQEPRLVQLHPEQLPVWMTELDKIQAKAQGINFLDITETPHLGLYASKRLGSKPSFPAPNATKIVKSVIDSLSTHSMKENIKLFTSFRTRHYRSDTGRQSQKWLLSKISEVTNTSAVKSVRDRIDIMEFPHTWGQNSIVVRINGTSPDSGVIIIGAHQDSTNFWPFLPAPGADDDGSGSVTILEAYRGLISADFQPTRTVEFHWYSAEEGGLLGSQALAQDYESRSVNVLAMSQFDMTAWVKQGTQETVGIITDFTDEALTEFNKKLVDLYLDIPYSETKCGYACSDHASWMKAGFPSAFTIESKFEDSNGHIHSANDRYDISDEYSFEHMLEFAKLATAFAVELGGWKKD